MRRELGVEDVESECSLLSARRGGIGGSRCCRGSLLRDDAADEVQCGKLFHTRWTTYPCAGHCCQGPRDVISITTKASCEFIEVHYWALSESKSICKHRRRRLQASLAESPDRQSMYTTPERRKTCTVAIVPKDCETVEDCEDAP
mmetsp:Transcript_56702/g.184548  ORF Transcript_56702/g.184548 Transcript_56702/m.184548 type:complete len:145 (+) Transcript_56702:238-672(+)